MRAHRWHRETAARHMCVCGSFIQHEAIGTAWEPYAVQCMDRACREVFDEYREAVIAEARS